jgi:hypothetical protein
VVAAAAAVTGFPALTTAVARRPLEEVGSFTRALMPTPAMTIEQTSDITTILRWVARSAVNIEELFMILPRLGH